MSTTTVTKIHVTRTGGEIEIIFPANFEVCDRCNGTGKHVNPSIDGNGLSREDFDQDPDFEEAYFRGDYDVSCSVCRGQRVVPVVDEERLTKRQRVLHEAIRETEIEMRRERECERYTRMMEDGCYSPGGY